jgi:hypothetical protein
VRFRVPEVADKPREWICLIAKTITVNQQKGSKQTTTSKGQTRRTIPMTATLYTALERLETAADARSAFVGAT